MNFSDTVKFHMEQREISQSELIKRSGLSKTTISRIYRNSNDKGSTYQPKDEVVMAVSIGLSLTAAEKKDLLYSAFPERELWETFLEKRLNIHQANEILYDNGLPLLGNNREE